MKWFICLLILLIIPIASAEMDMATQVYGLQQEVVNQDLPQLLSTLFGDERINLQLTKDDGEKFIIGIVTENDKIKSLEPMEVKDPTMNIHTTQKVVEEIMTSDNPLGEINKAAKEGKLVYRAVGFKNKIKFFFVSIITKVAGLFMDDHVAEGVGDVVEKEIIDEEETEELDEDVSDLIPDTSDDTEETTNATEELEPEEDGPKEHIILFNDDGGTGDLDDLVIKVGDTVVWENVRENKAFNKAMVLGVRNCADVKSKIFPPGETFRWTFTEAETCTIVDGIYTTHSMDIVVEE